MPLKDFHYQMLSVFLASLSEQHGIVFHVGGVLEYTGCDNQLLQFLSNYVIHQNPYCMYVKSSQPLWNRCICSKQRILEKLEKCDRPFYGVCHCGVKEYLAPVYCRGKVVGFLSFGCLRPDARTLGKRLRSTARRYGFEEGELLKVYEANIPPVECASKEMEAAAATLSLLFSCLADDLQLWNTPTSGGHAVQRILLLRVLEYLHIRYSKDISTDDLAKFCSCSKSYLQHLFREHYHTTISAYLEQIRMEKARLLLKNSELSIGEVADRVGYRDPNYFSMVFAKNHQMSPTAFRKQKSMLS